MPFVIDASITACCAFRDEDHPQADLALARLRVDEAFVPALWWFEVRKILVVMSAAKGSRKPTVAPAFGNWLAYR